MLINCSVPSNSGESFSPAALKVNFCSRSGPVPAPRTTSTPLLEAVDAVETVLFLANVEYSPCRLQQAQGRAHARLGLSGTVRAGGQLYGKVSGR
jgi:hypothetical protein